MITIPFVIYFLSNYTIPNYTILYCLFIYDYQDTVRGLPPAKVLLDPHIYDPFTIRKVLLVGSGGLSIGQAGEFDYSGQTVGG